MAGYLSLSFGIADFVLYIWVDDVFVRRNKSHGMAAISPSKDSSKGRKVLINVVSLVDSLGYLKL